MSKYRKAIVALAGFAAVFGVVASDGAIDGAEALQLVAALAAAYGVYRIPNAPPA